MTETHNWTRTEELRIKLWMEEGRTASYMAAQLCLTRSQVEGRIRRLREQGNIPATSGQIKVNGVCY